MKKQGWKGNHPICIEGIICGVKPLDQEGRYAFYFHSGDTRTNNQGLTLVSSVSIFGNEQNVSSKIVNI